ncbi:MAG: putative NurA 5'-3' nuclease [Promethearchaeota archaeon]|nr:MAG: putative NurA 5'-3' nuclease [Candidatus Lokiarchaeota archaeon]
MNEIRLKETPLKECIQFIEANKKEFSDKDSAMKSGEDEKNYEVKRDRFFEIPRIENERKIGFVDGGTAPLIISADFSISLNRVAGILQEHNRFLSPKKIPLYIEFYSATILRLNEEKKLEFITRLFPREEEYQEFLPEERFLRFSPYDITIQERRGFLPRIENLGAIAMRFSEWTYGSKFIENELTENDIFVRDGSLQTGYTGEIELADKLYSNGLQNGVYITGLSKTCRIPTKKGDSLISLVNSMGSKEYPDQAWYYHPIKKVTRADNKADLFFVKLHKDSLYPFRFDIFIEQTKDFEKEGKDEEKALISSLASCSDDLSFIGYPYGLIKVDQLARIPNRDLESQKVQLLSEFNKDTYESYILPRIRSMNAHDLLNKIRK